jgi:xylulokinase
MTRDAADSHLVAGVDSSTQSTKVVVVEVDTGRVAASGRAGHQVTGTGGARESDPEEWWSALGAALAQTGLAGSVAAIAVGGQQHGLVALDDGGRPLRPAMLWNDVRAAPEAAEMVERWGAEAWANDVGVVPVASFTACKWLWLARHEPEKAAAARRVMLPHDYLNFRLTGHPATDRGDASGTAWWSTATEEYSLAVLDLVALDRDLLPRVVPPGGAAGEVTGQAAAATGLAPGCLVAAGTGDNMGAALGLGLTPGTPVVSLGTSGTAYAVSTTRIADPAGTVAGFAAADGGYLPLAATLNCTLAVDRMAAWLGIDREAAADRTDVVVLPYLDGERTPNLPAAAGSVHGLRHTTTSGEILLAAYLGAAASLLEALAEIDRTGSGLDPRAPLLLIGGGARGEVWQRAVAGMAGRQVEVPELEEPVAMGAAVQAAALLTGRSPVELAGSWGTRRGTAVEPHDSYAGELDRIREMRSRIYGG